MRPSTGCVHDRRTLSGWVARHFCHHERQSKTCYAVMALWWPRVCESFLVIVGAFSHDGWPGVEQCLQSRSPACSNSDVTWADDTSNSDVTAAKKTLYHVNVTFWNTKKRKNEKMMNRFLHFGLVWSDALYVLGSAAGLLSWGEIKRAKRKK